MKRNFLLFVLLFSSIIVKAQGDYNYLPFGVGAGISSTHGYTNVNEQQNDFAGDVNFTFYESPYVPITAELQFGQLSGGSIYTDKYKRYYINNYKAVMLHGDVQLGELIDYYRGDITNVLKNFYLGTGVGFVKNKVQNNRTNLDTPEFKVGQYTYGGSDNTLNIAVTLRAGYEFKFYNEYDEPYIRLDIEYIHNVVFGEGLDGYNDNPAIFKNDYPDQYRQIRIGIKYDFGIIHEYTKRIRGVYY